MYENLHCRGNRRKLVLAALFAVGCLFNGNYAFAKEDVNSLGVANVQQKTIIKGSVKDANGEPIIGASVIEKGTTNGTLTDIDGQFSIGVSPNTMLKVSYIGYKAIEVKSPPFDKSIPK